MKEYLKNNNYIIAFDENVIENVTSLNSKINKTPVDAKNVVLDLDSVKYANSIFIDYIERLNSLLEANGKKLKVINCETNINELITKSHPEHNIQIKLKEV